MQTTVPVQNFPGLIKWFVAGIVSIWVSIPAAVQTLIVLMAIDYATGLVGALMQRKLSSAEGLRGLGKKSLTLLLIVAVHYVVKPLHLGIDVGTLVATAYCANEAISIAENVAEAGVPIPEAVMVILVRAKRITGRGRTAAEVKRDLDGASASKD